MLNDATGLKKIYLAAGLYGSAPGHRRFGNDDPVSFSA